MKLTRIDSRDRHPAALQAERFGSPDEQDRPAVRCNACNGSGAVSVHRTRFLVALDACPSCRGEGLR